MNLSHKIWDEFRSTICPICGGAKPLNNGFCRGCYHSLPKKLASRMWRRFGGGYEEAHEAARQWLLAKRAA